MLEKVIVIRDIEKLDCSPEFRELNFELSSYTNDLSNAEGRKYKKYKICKDGFTFLVMGYIGKKAAGFKEACIPTFNKMEAENQKLHNPAQMNKLDWIEMARQQEIETPD